MQRINYNDKVRNNGSSNSGQWTAENANEVKKIVNANALTVQEQYARKTDIIKTNAEYIDITGTALPQPAKSNGWTWLMGNKTYTQNNGDNITISKNKLGIASYNGLNWTLSGEIELPDNSSELKEWEVGIYDTGATRTIDGKIFRANKTTNLIPQIGSADWEIIGGSELDVDGGGVSNDRMKVSADYFNVGSLEFSIPSSFFLLQHPVGRKWSIYDQGQQASWYATKLIDTRNVKHFIISGQFLNNALGVAGFDADGEYLKPVFSIDGTVTNHKLTIPEDVKYITVSAMNFPNCSIVVDPDYMVDGTLDSAFNVINEKWEVNTNGTDDITILKGAYFNAGIPIGSQFTLFEEPEAETTGLVDVRTKKNVIITAFLSLPNGNVDITGFGEDQKYLRSLVNVTNSGVGHILVEYAYTAPDDVAYIAVPSNKILPLMVRYADDQGSSTKEQFNAQKLYDLMKGAGTNDMTTERYLSLARPKFGNIDFFGVLPTDTSDVRTATSLTFIIKDENQKTLVTGKCELSIQGHGSAVFDKKGYTFDVYNADGKSLDLKFGGMVATDSFHFKAFATDRTHSRDVVGGKIWTEMVKTLDSSMSRINNKVYTPEIGGREAAMYTHDAQYFTDGIPFRATINGSFMGLYTMRLKKKRENYALNNRNKDHIFLDSATYGAWLAQPFNSGNWDVKSPQISGYEEMGAITDAEVLGKIQRLWSFTTNLATQYQNHADFIDLPKWILYMINAELITHRDTVGNNLNLITWDGIHWVIVPYDLDATCGFVPRGDTMTGWKIVATQTGWIMSGDIGSDIWGTFRNVYTPQLRAEWTRLRKSGFITMANIMKYYYDHIKHIPRNVYVEDAARWPLVWENAEPTMLQMESLIQSRIDWLDTQWLIN